MTLFQPKEPSEVGRVVAWAAAVGQTLEIVAGGSKRAFGRPAATDHRLDVSAIRGIVDYDPAELVLTARTGTTMAEVDAALDSHRQMLGFEPPDWGPLLSGAAGPTLGGVIACNLSGPRRVRAGAARDHFLGFTAVNGLGDTWKAGGRVVKNVTGYDMCKLQAGACGTLSVLTEVSVRVLPRPETSCSVLVTGLGDEAAIRLLATALNSANEVSAAAHLPAAAAGRSKVTAVAGAGSAVTMLRLEGPHPSVAYRADTLEALLGAAAPGGAMRLDAAGSERLWQEIGAAHDFLGPDDSIVWRVCPTPSAAPALLRRVRATLGSTTAFYDWGGGLLWLGLDAAEAGPDGGAALVRAAVAEAGGHATLVRAPVAVRAAVPVFEPATGALDALTRRVKASFDPKRILNPGRMQDGI